MPEVVARLWRAPHIQQKYTYGGKLVGCTPTSMAVWLRGVSLGAIRATERTVIAMTNEPVPDPNSPGWNLEQMRSVAQKLQVSFIIAPSTADGYDSVRNRLDEDRRIVAQVELGVMEPGHNVKHAIEIECRRRGQKDIRGNLIPGYAMLINEPLKTRSQWMDEDVVLHAMKRLAEDTGKPSGLRFAYSLPVPMVAVVE